jgi:hypothetical protein
MIFQLGDKMDLRRGNGFVGGDDEFYFGHTEFELPVRHLAGDAGRPLNI